MPPACCLYGGLQRANDARRYLIDTPRPQRGLEVWYESPVEAIRKEHGGMDADLIVIGGGIVGLSTAMQALEQYPGLGVIVLEKESRIATHQTGHNSGVIHAGVYYQPGSLKAQFCREGASATMQFCREHDIAFEQCGKLLVATEPADLPRMDALYERAVANGIEIERWSQAEVTQAEPRIRSLG